jgi:hypothetical protein
MPVLREEFRFGRPRLCNVGGSSVDSLCCLLNGVVYQLIASIQHESESIGFIYVRRKLCGIIGDRRVCKGDHSKQAEGIYSCSLQN